MLGLTSLTSLALSADPLNQDAYNTYILQIQINNEGIDLRFLLGLSISSGEGGPVVSPGEGLLTCKYGDKARASKSPVNR